MMRKAMATLMLGVVSLGLLIPTADILRGVILQEAIATAIQSVVHVSNEGVCQGSGVIIYTDDKNALVLTAKHVVESGINFTVTTFDGKTASGCNVMEFAGYDLALIRVTFETPYPPVSIGCARNLRLGDRLFIIGSPLGFDNFNSVSLGILSSKSRACPKEADRYGWQTLMQTDAASMPGNSGGPVFAIDGKLVGIIVAGMGQSGNIGYFIPIDVIEKSFPTIIKLFRSSSADGAKG